jgi:hypothetical protein
MLETYVMYHGAADTLKALGQLFPNPEYHDPITKAEVTIREAKIDDGPRGILPDES